MTDELKKALRGATVKYAEAWKPDNEEAKDFDVTRAVCTVAFHACQAGVLTEEECVQWLLKALEYYADDESGTDNCDVARRALARYREGEKK